jgi:hypothetical protein
MPLVAQTDFIGPIPTGSTWSLAVTPIGEEANPVATLKRVVNVNPFLTTIDQSDAWSIFPRNIAWPEGHSLSLSSELTDPAGQVIDSGQTDVPWTNQRGLPGQLLLKPVGGQSGLPPSQLQLLQDTHDQVVLTKSLDLLTLTEISPGITGDPVSAQLLNMVFGVIVRLASVPENLVPITPDADYWLATLAVVRVFRGSDLWLRVPIHTSSKMVPFASQDLVVALSALSLTQWLLNMSVQVTFLSGVTGQVFLMRFP